MYEDAHLEMFWEDRLSGIGEWDVIDGDDPFLAPYDDDDDEEN